MLLRRTGMEEGQVMAKPQPLQILRSLVWCLVPSLVGKVTYKSDTRSVCKVSESVIRFFWLAHRSRASVAEIVYGEALIRHKRGNRDAHWPSGVSIDERDETRFTATPLVISTAVMRV